MVFFLGSPCPARPIPPPFLSFIILFLSYSILLPARAVSLAVILTSSTTSSTSTSISISIPSTSTSGAFLIIYLVLPISISALPSISVFFISPAPPTCAPSLGRSHPSILFFISFTFQRYSHVRPSLGCKGISRLQNGGAGGCNVTAI